VVGACGDLGDAGRDDLHGGVSIGRGAVAELAVGVLAHGVEAAVGLQEEAVVGDIGIRPTSRHQPGSPNREERKEANGRRFHN
jgi:hypothetical protein